MNGQQRKSTVEALINMVMYIYKSNLDSGMTVDAAKQDVALVLEDLVKRYTSEAKLEFNPSLVNPYTLFEQTVAEVKTLSKGNPSLIPTLNKLVTLQNMLKK